jgi:hypothetical protein
MVKFNISLELDAKVLREVAIKAFEEDRVKYGSMPPGIGTKAIDFIENVYPHIKRWSLDTPYQNYKNHDFYERQGYVKVNEIKPVKDIDFWLFEYVKET